MTFSEQNIYIDASSGLYRYTSDWLWREFSWDELADIDDLVGVGQRFSFKTLKVFKFI